MENRKSSEPFYIYQLVISSAKHICTWVLKKQVGKLKFDEQFYNFTVLRPFYSFYVNNIEV